MKRLFELAQRSLPYCNCKSCSAYTDQYGRYPVRWYEERWAIFAIFFPIALGGLWLQYRLGLYPNWGIRACGVVIYLLGEVVDIYATDQVHRMKPLFDERGLHFPSVEGNPLLPENPTFREQIFNVSTLLYLLFLPVVIIEPAAGIGAGIAKILHGAGSNLKGKQRMLAMLKVIGNDGEGCSEGGVFSQVSSCECAV